MKKIFFILCIFFVSITSSFAVVFIDVEGNYLSTGDYDPAAGVASSIGFSMSEDLNFVLRSSYAFNTINLDLPDEIKYSYYTATGGVEYTPSFSILEQYRIYWRNSLTAGMSVFNVEEKETDYSNKETGILLSLRTGLQYNYTQFVAPYFAVGFQRSFYNTASDLSANGWQLALGVRFYIGGSRDFDHGY